MHAVSELEDVPIQFWQKHKVFHTHNLFEVEGKAAYSLIEWSTDLIPISCNPKEIL